MTGIALSGVGAIGTVTPVSALTFAFNPADGTSQAARDGFAAAGKLWTDRLSDNVTINIDINFAPLNPGILGQASSTREFFSYSQVYTAMSGEGQSADDTVAFASLTNGSAPNSTFNMLLNRTSDSPNGSNSAVPYLDNNRSFNNTYIDMSSANAKALGLIPGQPSGIMTNTLMAVPNGRASIPSYVTAAGSPTIINSPSNINPQTAITANLGTSDASISFSTGFAFDFNPDDGITKDHFDFVGIAAHEIGHALGFTSGVDILDFFSQPANGGPDSEDEFAYVNTLDLFRYSAESRDEGAIDWTADNRAKYFSLDRGVTNIALFSNGVKFGDGRQASHWKDNSGLGIMDPTAGANERLTISENDLRALDVIGWNRVSNNVTAVPEPADFIGTLCCAAFTAKLVLKRRKKLFQSTDKATDKVA